MGSARILVRLRKTWPRLLPLKNAAVIGRGVNVDAAQSGVAGVIRWGAWFPTAIPLAHPHAVPAALSVIAREAHPMADDGAETRTPGVAADATVVAAR